MWIELYLIYTTFAEFHRAMLQTYPFIGTVNMECLWSRNAQNGRIGPTIVFSSLKKGG